MEADEFWGPNSSQERFSSTGRATHGAKSKKQKTTSLMNMSCAKLDLNVGEPHWLSKNPTNDFFVWSKI
jgi:hypothetical protein